jgi:mono/diheme cytochrome c family protein
MTGPEPTIAESGPSLPGPIPGAVEREHADPGTQEAPAPMWLMVFCGIVLLAGGVYLGMYSGGFRADVFNETAGAGAVEVAPAGGAPGTAGAPPASLAQQGKAVYSANCVACHQATGQGLPGQFPPLAGSEWVQGPPKRLAAIVLKGVVGAVTVKGKQFVGAMPPWEAALTDKKIAAVTSFIRQEWGNHAPEVTPEVVAAARQEFAGRKEPWTQADLEKIAEETPAPSAEKKP